MLRRFLTFSSPSFLSEVSEEPHRYALGPDHGRCHWLKQPRLVSKATKRRGLGVQDILFSPDTCASSAVPWKEPQPCPKNYSSDEFLVANQK